jgi:drug/metabolite transporter (DMT)-like permease
MNRSPIGQGIGLAALAAVLFGITAPVVQLASTGAGALACGALLYLGAAIAAAGGRALRSGKRRDAPVRAEHAGTLIAVALVGGLLAPVLLVLGLKRIDAASASLLLALEAPFTLVLARLAFHEHLGRRVLVAAVIILAGGLVATAGRPDRISIYGALLVAAASFGWAVDNTLSRRLADRDPLTVVAGKGLIGGTTASLVALALGQTWPSAPRAATLLVAGALGFGASLALYLRAQRVVGAARTASVFSIAPFVGAAAALALGTRWPGWGFALGALLIGAGVWLHATERHDHFHVHGELEHEHLHTHDDGHHDHVHDPMPVAPHAHRHTHRATSHSHAHSEDLHHRHEHEV